MKTYEYSEIRWTLPCGCIVVMSGNRALRFGPGVMNPGRSVLRCDDHQLRVQVPAMGATA